VSNSGGVDQKKCERRRMKHEESVVVENEWVKTQQHQRERNGRGLEEL